MSSLCRYKYIYIIPKRKAKKKRKYTKLSDVSAHRSGYRYKISYKIRDDIEKQKLTNNTK